MNLPALPNKQPKRRHKAEAQADVDRIFARLLAGHKTTIESVYLQLAAMVGRAAFKHRHSRDVAEFVKRYNGKVNK